MVKMWKWSWNVPGGMEENHKILCQGNWLGLGFETALYT
jgi:hypothetical protein